MANTCSQGEYSATEQAGELASTEWRRTSTQPEGSGHFDCRDLRAVAWRMIS